MKKILADKWGKPLPPPTFGIPYNGRQCSKCGGWFDRRHFRRRDTFKNEVYVKRCRECIATGLGATTKRRRSRGSVQSAKAGKVRIIAAAELPADSKLRRTP